MKTTVHLPDDLVTRAKVEAHKRRTSLRALIEQSLRRELDALGSEDLDELLGSLRDEHPGLWEGVDADAYVEEQRAAWDE